MAYPKELIFDFYANQIAEDFGIDNIGTPKFEVSDDSDDTTGYRFATKPISGCCYIKWDRNAT
jgi:hypothetical protein